MYEAHGWMITVYQHDYSYGKSKIPKHEADRKKESINRVERRERVQLQSIKQRKRGQRKDKELRIGEQPERGYREGEEGRQ